MKTIKLILAVIAVAVGLAAVAQAAQPVIYTLTITNAIAPGSTVTITNPVWVTQSGGTLANLDVGLQSQFSLYATATAAVTNSGTAGTNGTLTVSGQVSPDAALWTTNNAPALFTLTQNGTNAVSTAAYTNQSAASWRYWGGVLTVTCQSSNTGYGPSWTNSTGGSSIVLKSFWKAP